MPSPNLCQELRGAYFGGLPIPESTEPQLRGALHQTLTNPGNLIRAQLASGICRAYHLSDEVGRQVAVAIEYFHTASLLLDDLPCMDNAAERRGMPCVHHSHGEATAMLSALALINRAYGLLWQTTACAAVDRQPAIGRYVERCLGLEGILNGQSQDLHYPNLTPARRSPPRVAVGKTVSLIRLSLGFPALLGNAPPGEVHLLERLALFWGLSYQILDDLKDIYAQAVQTGKTIARDASLQRPNLALTVGPAEALATLERFLNRADRTLHRLSRAVPDLGFLRESHRRFQAESDEMRNSVLLSRL